MAEPPGPGALAARLRSLTAARVGLGRAGAALPTAAMLEFELAHARARDAVHAGMPAGAFGMAIAGRPVIEVASCAPDRATYLRRPDLGRRLAPEAADALAPGAAEIALVLADGLSATAVLTHGAALVSALVERFGAERVAPIVVAHQARVAIGDAIGARLGVQLAIVLIGERPGLSAADGIGAYLTWAPRPGRLDSERNCVSNIRPGGIALADAVDQIAALADGARALGATGVRLKIEAPSGRASELRHREQIAGRQD